MPRLLLGLVLGALASIIWGGHAVLARLAVTAQGFSVLDILFARYVPAALLLAPLGWHARREILALGPWRLLTLAAFGGAGNLGLFIWALEFAPATHGATVAPMTGPVVAAFAAYWILGERPTPGRIAALAVMLAGVLIIGWEGLGMTPGAWRGDLLLVLGGGTWGIFGVLLRRWRIGAIAASAAVSIVSAPIVLPLFLAFSSGSFFTQPPLLLAWMIFAQGFLLGFVSMLLFARSVEMLGPTRAGTLSVLVPVIGMLGAWAILGEPIGLWQGFGAAMAVGAMLVAVLFTGRR